MALMHMPIKQRSWDALVGLYRWAFARARFRRLNEALFHLSLRGLGVLNYENDHVSGEHALLARILAHRRGAVVLDVGGNAGQYAAAVLRVSPTALVHSFEPHPATFMRLAEAAVRLGFQANNCACGASAGSMELFDHESQDGSEHASLYRESIECKPGQHANSRTVQVVTISDYWMSIGSPRVALLKIDVEGHEMSVLRGCSKLLETGAIEAIHLEFNEMNVYSRVFMRDLVQLLPRYRFFRLLPRELLPLDPYVPLTQELFAYQNLLIMAV